MTTRTCTGCMTARPQRELLRFARRPDGVAVPRTTGGAARPVAGRSAYVCPDRVCMRAAIARRGLQRTLAGPRALQVRVDAVDAAWTAAQREIERALDVLQRTRARPGRIAALESLRSQMRAPGKEA